MTDRRRVYYDHEQAYQEIKASGGRGWDARFPGTNQQSYATITAFLDHAALPPGTRALEIGCGGGEVAIELARRGLVATGIDYSETAIELARDNAREAGLAVRFEVGDALELAGFADHTFDLVVDNHCLHCIVVPEQRARLLASAFRVLERGGRLWSETMAAEGQFDAVRFAADPETGIAYTGGRIWIRRAVLEREVLAAGFEIMSLVQRDDADPRDGSDLVTVARKP